MLGGRGRRVVGRVPVLVWAATAAFTVALAAYAVLMPLFEAPDEPGHVDLVLLLADGGDYPAYDGRFLSVGVNQGCAPYIATIRRCPGDRPLETIPVNRYHVEHAASDAPPKGSRPTFEELGGAEPLYPPNQLTQHPPLYYKALAGALQVVRFVVPGSMSFVAEVALLRLLSALIVAPLPLLAWATGRRLGLGERAAAVAALAPLAVPQLLHIGSTVNNDGLLITLGGVVAMLVAGVVTGDRRWGTALALTAACGAALLTKTSAVGLVALVALGFLVAWGRAGGPVLSPERRAVLARAGVVALGVAALAAWWYIRNKVEHGSFVPSIDTETLEARDPPPGFEPSPATWAETFAAYFTPRFWSWFGWFSVRGTFRLTVGASALTVGLLALGVAFPRSRDTPDGRRPRRVDLALMLVPGLFLFAMVVVRGWLLHVTSGQYPFIQGRYLFPGLAAGAVVLACGVDRLARRWAAPAVVLWAGVMHVDAVRAILKGYWAGEGDGLAGRIRSLVAWSPWPGELLALGGVVAVATGAFLIVALVQDLRRGPDRPAPGSVDGPSPGPADLPAPGSDSTDGVATPTA